MAAGSIFTTGLYLRYENIVDLLLSDLRRTPAILPLALEFSSYWGSWIEKLSFNPEKGVWDLGETSSDSGRSGGTGFDELELGQLAWHQGNFAAAVAHLEAHQQRRGETESSLFWLAMAYLRLAEAENCLAELHPGTGRDSPRDSASMCALPLRALHRQRGLSRTAAKHFERLLDAYDAKNRLYRWLLNVSYMTIGGFPDEVPRRYRIHSPFIDYFYGEGGDEIENRTRRLAFRERAAELGVATLNSGKGVAVEDFDRDGYLDIITGGQYSDLVYYRNRQGRGFEDCTVEAGLSGIGGIHLVTAADYDDDGWMDVFVSRPNGPSRGSFVLLRNNGGDEDRGGGPVTFTDVTREVGLLGGEPAEERVFNWASAWGDVDNDGDLDLFLANFSLFNPFGSGPLMSSALLLNQGGRFDDVTRAFGLEPLVRRQAVFGAAFGDYDGDGFVDLSITHWAPGKGFLLKNLDGRSFQDTGLIVPDQAALMTAFLDADQDGDLDVFYGSQSGFAEAITTQAVFGEREEDFRSGRSALWLQEAGRFSPDNGFFRDQMPIGTMGSSFGDLDNDGAYDFYLGTGSPEGWYILPNLMYLGETFEGKPLPRLTNISRLFGFGTLQKGHGIVFFDFDNDGDQDVYSSLGGMWPGDAWPNQLFVNESTLDAAWTRIRLRGRTSNSHGLGARIKVAARSSAGRPLVRYYHMDNKTGFGSAPYLAHIGLGDAVAIDRVEVTWPGRREPEIYTAQLRRLNVLEENGGSVTSGELLAEGAP